MGADELLRLLTQVPFVLIFVAVAFEVARRPYRASLDVALFFGSLAVVVIVQWVTQAAGETPRWASVLNGSLIMALPYLLLRLVDDFAGVPAWLKHVGEAGLALSVLAIVAFAEIPLLVLLPIVAYFFALQIYAAVRFVERAARTRGVTRRRMQAAAAGSAFLGATILIAGLTRAAPGIEPFWSALSRVTGLASGLSYLLAFAPPGVLRRAWQEPEVRALLARAAELPRLPDHISILHAIEEGVAAALGAQAAVAVRDPETRALVYPTGSDDDRRAALPVLEEVEGTGRSVFYPDLDALGRPRRADAPNAARALMATPIAAGGRQLGVLSAYSTHAPLFAHDDLALLEVLSVQAASVLEARALIDEAASVRALEEATRLKDDFLSAAAHDLKTPLASILAQAQLLERRAGRHPDEPVDRGGLRRIVVESERLRRLLRDLMDVVRSDQISLVGERTSFDLAELARTVVGRHDWPGHSVRVEAPEPVFVEADRDRIDQLLSNLLENAAKYSPEGGEIRIALRREDGLANIAVTDSGLGIPASDVEHVFDRFRRGSNVDDRTFAGMGLGLFICRQIAEHHGGTIRVDSTLGKGSTFVVVLPAQEQVAVR